MSTLMELAEEFGKADDPARSRVSQEAYYWKVRAYVRTLPEGADVTAFTVASVRDYLRAFADHARPRTQRVVLAALRAFGKWLVETKHLPDNPAAGVRGARLDAPRRETPDNDQVLALLAGCDHPCKPYRRSLAGAVIGLLVYTAIRRSELLHLKLTDVDRGQECIHIRHGKGDNRLQGLPLAFDVMEAAVDCLESDWAASRKLLCAAADAYAARRTAQTVVRLLRMEHESTTPPRP